MENGINMEDKRFPNGFESWCKTYYEIVDFLICTSKVVKFYKQNSTGGMYELARELTDKFETLNKGREWNGEFFEELEHFLIKELNDLESMVSIRRCKL
jgi:hypothetical protein